MFGSDGIEDERRPCAEEIYELATNASNLRQEAERRGAADVLRDMAMSTDRLGAALRRLRGQWEAVEKPTRQRTRSIKEWLAVYTEPTYEVRDADGKLQTLTRAEAAEKAYQEERTRHDGWFEREMQRLVGQLADLPVVRDAITAQAVKWRMGLSGDPIERAERAELRDNNLAALEEHRKAVKAAADDAEKLTSQATLNHWIGRVQEIEREEAAEDRARAQAKASAVIRYWLDINCARCGGTKWETVQGTNRQGTKACKACHGSGVAPVPHQQDGRRLANHMDQCLHRHKQTLSARRKALGAIPPIDRLSKRMQPSDESD